MKQTIKYGKARLVRFDATQIFSYAVDRRRKIHRPTGRAGIVRVR